MMCVLCFNNKCLFKTLKKIVRNNKKLCKYRRIHTHTKCGEKINDC